MKTARLTVLLLLVGSTACRRNDAGPAAAAADSGTPSSGGSDSGTPDVGSPVDHPAADAAAEVARLDGPDSAGPAPDLAPALPDAMAADRPIVGRDAGVTSRLSRCVREWPAPAAWQWRAPLSGPPRRLWTKWLGPETVASARAVTGGTKVAVTAADRLYLVGRDGTPSAGASSGAVEVLTAPIAEGNGRYYSAGHSAYAYDQEGNLSFWRKTFTRPLANEWSTAADVALSPGGVLLTTSNDGHLYAVRTSDGQLAWKREMFSTGYTLAATTGPGVGDAFVVNYTDQTSGQFQGPPGSRLHDLATGEPLGALTGPSGGGLWVTSIGPQGFVTHDGAGGLHLADRCGALAWSVQGEAEAPPRSSLVLPDGTVVAAGPTAARTFRVSTYSPSGTKQAGPVDWGAGALPVAVGADGALYAVSCHQGGETNPPALQVFDRALRPVARVDLGLEKGSNGFYPCPQWGVTMTDDGVMYLVTAQPSAGPTLEAGLLLTAVQTTSPGVAVGGWSLAGHDPRGTNWFAP